MFAFVDSPLKKKKRQNLKSYERRLKSKKTRQSAAVQAQDENDSDSVSNCDDEMIEPEADSSEARLGEGQCNQVDNITVTAERIQLLETEVFTLSTQVATLRDENNKLTTILNSPEPLLDENNLKENDSLVAFYTGLPNFAVLMTIFNLVAPAVTSTARCALPKFSQMICVLLKLRLGVPDQDIAYRFKVSRSTISRSFQKWVDAMYVRLKPLIIWPTRENVQKTMPSAFRSYFGRCIAIIDCFEVFIERPSSLVARAQTYSNYKSQIPNSYYTSRDYFFCFKGLGW